MREYPQWATPQRRAVLVELWLKHGNRCLQGHPNCPNLGHYRHLTHKVELAAVPVKVQSVDSAGQPIPGLSLTTYGYKKVESSSEEWVGGIYFLKEDEAIDYWKADDREERSFLWTRERRRLHALRPQIRKRGPFDSIRREQYLADRPVFEIVAIGVAAFTFKRVAQVRIPEFRAILWVDLKGLEISRNKFRKLARFKRGAAPKAMEPLIVERCRQAVQRYLNRAPR